MSPFLSQVGAQLTGTVGPTNALSTKTVTCSVLDYGGEVGSSDIGPAILDAFNVSLTFAPAASGPRVTGMN